MSFSNQSQNSIYCNGWVTHISQHIILSSKYCQIAILFFFFYLCSTCLRLFVLITFYLVLVIDWQSSCSREDVMRWKDKTSKTKVWRKLFVQVTLFGLTINFTILCFNGGSLFLKIRLNWNYVYALTQFICLLVCWLQLAVLMAHCTCTINMTGMWC